VHHSRRAFHSFLGTEKRKRKSWTENRRSFNFLGSLASSKSPSKSYFHGEKSSAKSVWLLSSHSPSSSLLTSKSPSSYSSIFLTTKTAWIIPKRTLPIMPSFLISSPPNGLHFGSSYGLRQLGPTRSSHRSFTLIFRARPCSHAREPKKLKVLLFSGHDLFSFSPSQQIEGPQGSIPTVRGGQRWGCPWYFLFSFSDFSFLNFLLIFF